jgi:signal transduction histidine kinase
MPRNWTARMRLTVLYGVLVLAAGAVLLAVVYYLLDRSIANQVIEVPVVQDRNTGQMSAETKRQRVDAEARLREEIRQQTLTPVLERSLVALGGLTAAGLVAGWLIAGRTLRPLHKITTTAKRVADRNLHERIALGGPRDELRELADTFDDMLSRLDAAFEGQRLFVGNASHELKTPLAINRTLLEVAMNRPNASVEVRSLGETLLAVNTRHERLVDGLLTLARSEHTISNTVPADLAELAELAVRDVQDESRKLNLTVTLEATATPVQGDPLLLERLVRNLVHNAVRHNTTDGWIHVDIRCHADFARLIVTNTGQHVSASSVSSIFEPFQRGTNRVRSTQGTGLGLSIVRSVVRAHRGSVSAQPRAGGGMVVEVRLPTNPAA